MSIGTLYIICMSSYEKFKDSFNRLFGDETASDPKESLIVTIVAILIIVIVLLRDDSEED